jgi:glycosyltransferase involved in cell wall biosynthesis
VGNGIDTLTFDPAGVAPHPDFAPDAGPHFVFTGQMDYPPNVEAAVRASRRLMPAIRRVHPGARFHVVGRAPDARVLALEGVEGTRVWGEVPDVRPFLAAADIVLAPLAIARGVQNKVLEAMAMARPVVLSHEAATGIDALDGEHYAVGRDDDALAAQILALLSDPDRARAMGAAARRFVIERKGWDAALAPLAVLLDERAAARDAA